MIRKDEKTAVIEANRTHATDTGSPEVQIAILTARIQELTEHQKVISFLMGAVWPKLHRPFSPALLPIPSALIRGAPRPSLAFEPVPAGRTCVQVLNKAALRASLYNHRID